MLHTILMFRPTLLQVLMVFGIPEAFVLARLRSVWVETGKK